jgi:hypothetical protein
VENIKNGFLWGLGFGVAITFIVLIIRYVDPPEIEKLMAQTPTKVTDFEVISKVNRVEGNRFIVAGEYKVTSKLNFDRYKIDVEIRNDKGVFIHHCDSEVDKYQVEVERAFTKIVECYGLSDLGSAASVEVNLIGYK